MVNLHRAGLTISGQNSWKSFLLCLMFLLTVMPWHGESLSETWSGERSAELVSTSEIRNPKPTLKTKPETRNPKPETDSEDLLSPGPIETRKPKPETDSEDLPSPWTDRNPKPETRNRQRKLVSSDETRNPKPETRNRQGKLVSIDETRNPKPETRNPKLETDSNPTFGWLSGSELLYKALQWLWKSLSMVWLSQNMDSKQQKGYGTCGSAALSPFLKVGNRHPFFIFMRAAIVQLCCSFCKAFLTDPIGSSQKLTLRATIAILGNVSSRQLLFHVHLISLTKPAGCDAKNLEIWPFFTLPENFMKCGHCIRNVLTSYFKKRLQRITNLLQVTWRRC